MEECTLHALLAQNVKLIFRVI